MKIKALSNVLALFCVFVWGVTFISTKVLLRYFDPTSILIYRLIICVVFLFILSPRLFKLDKILHEIYFLLAGASGITFYFLLENFAVKYTSATSVGIIVALAPMFTMLFCTIAFKETKISINLIIGFIIAITGIVLMSLDSLKNDSSISVKGVVLASMAMLCWGFYSCFVKKINNLGYDGVKVTRRIMIYGLLLLIPFHFILKGDFNVSALKHYKVVLNILFLGLVASALCFVFWNYAVLQIGPIKCNIYLYLSPTITMIFSCIILHEKINLLIVIGMLLSILGLFISSNLLFKNKLKDSNTSDKISLSGEDNDTSINKDEGNL